MKIKQIINDKVNSFEFNFDLSEKDYIKKLLLLYGLQSAYICIYDLNKIKEKDIMDYFETYNIHYWHNQRNTLYAIEIGINDISKLLSIVGRNFGELVIWSCYTDWETFIRAINDIPQFFSFKKKVVAVTNPRFYLRFNIDDYNCVEIICDLAFNDGGNITKDDLLSILIK